MAVSISVNQSSKLYLRNPEESELGRKIVSESISLIVKLGFEEFTFKKLAAAIRSTEASIYRYFENKHKLLIYLISWYWAWLEYLIEYKTNNISDPVKKIRIIIKIIAETSSKDDPNSPHIDESSLHKIVVAESAKAYLTKNVDSENKAGLFANYQSLCKAIYKVIQEINPKFPYPRAMASNLIETAHEQIFFSQHLPGLSDVPTSKNDYSHISEFLELIFFATVKTSK
ncbi:MAG TPA: TetR/AcrR family transcriptional regulator [Bacteroidia bacterium]|jgi:AcrR family transcriptional regulator|nr:TetR/AcrR family transcriptional regulator [Bacteroidia bacterium]